MTIADLIDAARGGSPRAAGRLLSLVEGERRDEVLATLDYALSAENQSFQTEDFRTIVTKLAAGKN